MAVVNGCCKTKNLELLRHRPGPSAWGLKSSLQDLPGVGVRRMAPNLPGRAPATVLARANLYTPRTPRARSWWTWHMPQTGEI